MKQLTSELSMKLRCELCIRSMLKCRPSIIRQWRNKKTKYAVSKELKTNSARLVSPEPTLYQILSQYQSGAGDRDCRSCPE